MPQALHTSWIFVLLVWSFYNVKVFFFVFFLVIYNAVLEWIFIENQKKKLFPLINQKFNNFLIFFLSLTCASTQLVRDRGNISSLFLVILRWRLCSFGISNLTCSPLCQSELFMEKNNPLCRIHCLFLFNFFFPLSLIAQGRKSPAVRAGPLGLMLKSSVSLYLPLCWNWVLIYHSFHLLLVDPNEKSLWC